MANYSLHFLDVEGQVETFESLRACSDREAIDKAMACADPRSLEVWIGERMVSFIHGLTALSPGDLSRQDGEEFASSAG